MSRVRASRGMAMLEGQPRKCCDCRTFDPLVTRWRLELRSHQTADKTGGEQTKRPNGECAHHPFVRESLSFLFEALRRKSKVGKAAGATRPRSRYLPARRNLQCRKR